MTPPAAILIEVIYKNRSCLPCVYMEAAVREVLPDYAGQAVYERVDLATEAGKKRFLALSCALFGEEGVFKRRRLAPVPSLFINGELVFDAIPPRDELEAAVREFLVIRAHGEPDQSARVGGVLS